MSELRVPDSAYDYGPPNLSVSRPGDGSRGVGRPRAWDTTKRPVVVTLTNYRGYPHWFARLQEARNPFLGEDEGRPAWVYEYDDVNAKDGRSLSGEFLTPNEAIAWAEETFREVFGEERFALVRDWGGGRVVNLRDLIEREGD